MDKLIIVIVAFQALSMIIGFISATQTLFDKTGIGRIRLTPAGITVVICGIISVALPVLQNSITEANQKKDQDNRDSVMRAKYDTSILKIKSEYEKSTTKTITTITDVLAKYGYKLDSTNQVLIGIRDSAGRKIYMSDDPVLLISASSDPLACGIVFNRQVTDSSNLFDIILESKDAGSSFF